jgi:two-component system, sensor histidine kinase and response regulator
VRKPLQYGMTFFSSPSFCMKTILLIDDSQELRTTFCIALRTSGYHVIEADSGIAGLKIARQYLPDLILSDIHMPGGDGSTLLRDIRRDPELKSRQVVLMTGRPDLVTSRQGMEEGADDFLVKPVTLKALLSCVKARFSRASISWRVEDQMLAQLRSCVPSQLPHEFFTPLNGIIGLTELLCEEFSSFTPEAVGEMLKHVYQSSLRLQRTLRNYLLILELQNVSSQPLPPRLSSLEVEERIRIGVNQALRQYKQRRQDVRVRIDACSLSIGLGDLSRIVEELVDNACKFSRQETPVRVELSGGGRLIITDRGRGLTAEEISRIGAFQQFDRRKYEQQGLGLGLVLVQKLMVACQAEFSISSVPGEGTQVQIAFPRAEPGPKNA